MVYVCSDGVAVARMSLKRASDGGKDAVNAFAKFQHPSILRKRKHKQSVPHAQKAVRVQGFALNLGGTAGYTRPFMGRFFLFYLQSEDKYERKTTTDMR